MIKYEMSFIQAVRKRRAVRGFLPDTLTPEQIGEVLQDAQWSPSNCNTQPWHVHILSGEVKDQLSRLLLAEEEKGNQSPDFWFDQQAYTGAYSERVQHMGKSRYEALGIAREDKQARRKYALRNLHFYDAPHVALLFMPHFGDDVRTAGDIGMYAQTFMLSLVARGYASVPQTLPGMYAGTIKKFLNLPDELKMMFGISFGYADLNAPAAQINLGRADINSYVTFHQ
ncbi:TPA: nitroreductase [Citrobacter freundii]